jgi:hypothetical protein
VSVALGPRFVATIPIVEFLAIFAAINFPFAVAGSVQERISWMRSVWAVQGVMAAAMVGGTTVALLTGGGTIAIVLAACLAVASAHLVQLILLARRRVLDGSRLATAYMIHVGAAAATFALVRSVQLMFGGMPALAVGALQAMLGGALVFVVVTIPRLPAATALSSRNIRLRLRKLAL